MNKYQRVILTIALIDVVVVAMFPPFADRPLAKYMLPSFDGFYPLFMKLGKQSIYTDLLSMVLMLIVANALAAWLALQLKSRDELKDFRYGTGIAIAAGVNALIMLLFPPFEQYNSLLRAGPSAFDSFNFLLGPRSARPIFTPLLYLEIIFVLINALSIYLFFNVIRRSEDAQRARLISMADRLSDEDLDKLSGTMRALVDSHRTQKMLDSLGRKADRRHGPDPNYKGPERRRSDRRHQR